MPCVNIFPILLIITVLFGCSSANNSVLPGTPPQSDNPINSSYDTLPIYVSDSDSQGNPAEGYGIMGLFELVFKDENASLVPLRKAALEDVLEVVDVVHFLSLAPCFNCVKIESISLDLDENVVVSIGVKHPFSPGDPLKPISGQNRADLHVFNVEGIVISNSAGTAFPGLDETTAATYLKNADGLTGYLAASIDDLFASDATIHPYILHFDDYSFGNFDPLNPFGFASVTDPPPSGNLIMAMGSDYDYQDYVFDLEGSGTVEFVLAVGCTYAVSAGAKSQRFIPEYRVPQHNKKAASEARVEITDNSLEAGNTSSTANLTMNILDINHGVGTGAALNEMEYDSSVSNILVEIPGITLGPQSDFSFTSGDGRDPLNPLQFNVTVTNTAGGDIGTYQGLIKVLDSYPPGQNTSPLLAGMDGIKRVDPLLNPLTGLFDINDFSTYTTFEITISTVNTPPVADLEPNPAYVCAPGTIIFDATASTDDGSIVRYEWDWDLPSGDPVDFVMDDSSTGGILESPPFSTPGSTFTAVRVFDDSFPELYGTAVVPVSVGDTGIALNPTVVDIPSSGLTDINFSHTQDTLSHETHQATRGMEGLAVADGYIYAAFFADGGGGRGIHFTSSADGGASWDTPSLVQSFTATEDYGGCSIDAADSEVHIAYSPSGLHPDSTDNSGNVYLLSNYTNGSGIWTQNLVKAMGPDIGVGHIGIAVDPLNTNNIYVGYGQFSSLSPSWWYYDYIRVSTTNNGANGPYVENVMEGPSDEPDDNYGIDIAVSPVDGDVYVLSVEAYYVGVYRSEDNGATFPQDPTHYERFYAGGYYWSRDTDLALHPTDGDVYYVALACRRNSAFPIRIFKSTDGINLIQVTASVVDVSSARQIMPSITVNDDGVVYVSWVDNRTGDYEVYLDYMPDGGSFSTDLQVSSGSSTNERDPEIKVAPDVCDIVIVWEENGDQSGGTLKSRRG